MKKCPKCAVFYNDNAEICLTCNIPLNFQLHEENSIKIDFNKKNSILLMKLVLFETTDILSAYFKLPNMYMMGFDFNVRQIEYTGKIFKAQYWVISKKILDNEKRLNLALAGNHGCILVHLYDDSPLLLKQLKLFINYKRDNLSVDNYKDRRFPIVIIGMSNEKTTTLNDSEKETFTTEITNEFNSSINLENKFSLMLLDYSQKSEFRYEEIAEFFLEKIIITN